MAGWRSRGYVPDSEEEEESSSNKSDSQKRHVLGITSGEVSKDIDDITGIRPDSDDILKKNLDSANLSDVSPQFSVQAKQPTSLVDGSGYFAGVRLAALSSSQSTDELQEDHFLTYSKSSSPLINENEPRVHHGNLNDVLPNRLQLSSQSSPPSLSPAGDSPPEESHGLLRDSDQPASEGRQEAGLLSGFVNDDPGRASDPVNGQEPRRTRSLRQRNPIQLHPYAIEGEKYRQILKARGVKPLRIASGESQLAGGSLEDSQAEDFNVNTESQDNHLGAESSLSLSPIRSLNASPQSFQPTFPDFNVDQDDLPDVEAILRSMPQGMVSNGHKRRKTRQSYSKKNQEKVPSTDRQASVQVLDTSMDDVGSSIVDIPPSPPRSRTPTSTPSSRSQSRGFRIPKGLSPMALPTPVASSEPRRKQPISLSEASQQDGHTSVGESSGEDDEPSARESKQLTNRRLEGVQRRIRGVLPASWLRLDLKAQAKDSKKQTRRDDTPSPEKSATPQRGIARPVAPQGVRRRTTDPLIDIIDSSSDSDSSDRGDIADTSGQLMLGVPQSPRLINMDDEDLPMVSDLWGEVAEDNRIDSMLPSISRRNGHRKSGQAARYKKTQTRLTDLRLERGQSDISQTLRNRGSGSCPRPIERHRTPRKPKFRPPDLSLLDIPVHGTPSSRPVPSFIRVAQRTVRSRKDKGRSNPKRKYVRLATEHETVDANEYLRSWREGALTPTVTSSSLHPTTLATPRIPLQPCTGNQGILRDGIRSDEPALKTPNSREVRLGNRPIKPRRTRIVQSSLDHLIQFSTANFPRTNQRETIQVRRSAGTEVPREQANRAGHLSTSIRDPDHARPATLESLQVNADHDHPRSAFRRRLHRNGRSALHDQDSNPLLAKFLGSEGEPAGAASILEFSDSHEHLTPGLQTRVNHPRPRKRRARRLEVQSTLTPGLDEVLTIDDLGVQASTGDGTIGTAAALTGLGPYGTVYTTTFAAAPLPTGSYFSEATFIGSGDFGRSFINNDLDHARGFFVFKHREETFRWGPWNDNVSTQLSTLIDEVCGRVWERSQQGADHNDSALDHAVIMLGDVIRYVSGNLSFYDPVDRGAFLERCKDLVSILLQALTSSHYQSDNAAFNAMRRLYVQAGNLCAVLAGQLCQVSKHHAVTQVVQDKIVAFLQNAVTQALNIGAGEQLTGLSQCVQSLNANPSSPIAFTDHHVAIETIVVASHVLTENDSMYGFWRALQPLIVPPSAEPLNDVRVLERCWQRLFLVLPFLEIDGQGVLEPGRRNKVSTENWTIVNRLLEPVLATYQSNTQRQASTINDYCRAVYGRCLELIHVWGWSRCESNIGILFDFFARRKLFHLPNEESHGSPPFLSLLNQQPSLAWSPDDRCFHLLLKVIGSGLQHLQKVYPSKRIRSIVWRLMPNHGRFLPKDQAIRQTELDALRNHHDLLCTLYWASPQGFRPKPTVIQNLVDLENSHKEACRINIRAWQNLVMFQLSAIEDPASIAPFITWYSDLLGQILRQHRNARAEAEEQVRLAETTGEFPVNRSLLESTIAQNQRQVEGLLSEALLSMRHAVTLAPDLDAIKALLLPDVLSVLDLFSIQSPQSNKVIVHALEVFVAFATRVLPQSQVTNTEDESQDYGDWSAFDTDVSANFPTTDIRRHLEQHLQQPIRQLLSNCFGADKPPEDALLIKVVEAWVVSGHISVLEGSKTWPNYIGDYGPDSWASLRDTEQTRKFSAYYLAVLIDTDKKVFKEYKHSVLKAWISSLVERDSLLKYQHRLTSSLLNADLQDAILTNPPFSANSRRFDITPTEFSERRLSLISNTLSNMRKSLDFDKLTEAAALKANYKELLKVMMNAMKSNYQELGQGPDIRGAYVDFVHRVIELLQQHTSSLCPIDRFFTDSSSFPLPATDPSYVVGQLKNYGLRLGDHRTAKQLVVFMQSVSERAAVDGQQGYLVEQLSAAMAGQGVNESTELRTFLVTNVFPAYIEVALDTACGWIVAFPILRASRVIFGSILQDINGADKMNVGSETRMLTGFLGCLQRSMNYLISRPELNTQPRTLKMLTAYFAIVTAVLPTLDYLCRLSGNIQHAAQLVMRFKHVALFVAQSVLGHTTVEIPVELDGIEDSMTTGQSTEVQIFALQELRGILNKNWTCHEDHYYIIRGQTRKEVVVDIGLFEEEKSAFVKGIEDFFGVMGRMEVLNGSMINA
ncbi:MAG: hypothetical protein Q9218_004953 [Villophora microphyllina]